MSASEQTPELDVESNRSEFVSSLSETLSKCDLAINNLRARDDIPRKVKTKLIKTLSLAREGTNAMLTGFEAFRKAEKCGFPIGAVNQYMGDLISKHLVEVHKQIASAFNQVMAYRKTQA